MKKLRNLLVMVGLAFGAIVIIMFKSVRYIGFVTIAILIIHKIKRSENVSK